MNNLISRFFSFLLFLCVLLVGIANCGELKLTPVIPTTYGPIQGSVGVYKEVKVFQYKGVPYAKPPLGPLRFRRPSPPDRWTETLKVTEYGKSCIQNQQGGSAVAPEDSDENCLFLNVFTTQAAYQEREVKKRSVLFWIHGGAFLGGSSTERDAFNPIPLVPLHDVILVTINYRLNVFGFLLPGEAVPEIHGNMGMWDQNFALRWVHDNIGQFGGDPRQVTIFGESAGSISVGLHLISPMSKHLFKRAIMESGAPWPVAPNARQSVINSSLNVIDKVGCSGKENPLKCLQEMDASEFLLTKFPPLHLEMKPIFGDEFLPKTPEEAFKDKSFNKGKNLLVGSEQNDGSLFLGIFNASFIDPKVQLSYSDGVKGLKAITGGKNLDFFVNNYLGSSKDISTKRIRSALIKALGDILFTCPTYAFGHSLANLSQSENQVFGYMHTQKPKKSMIGICNIDRSLGPCHTDEIPYVFGEPFRKPKEFTKADFLLSMNMMKIWIDFARTGEPPQQGPVQWPKFSHKDGKTHIMELNDRFIGKLITNRPSFCIDYWHIFSTIPML